MNVTRMVPSSLYFFVNGQEVIEAEPDPEWTLLYYLRRKLKLTGVKYGCGEGGCGACTVMVSKMDRNGSIKHTSVNACLTPVVSLHGTAITTIEGIGSVKTKLHPIQERLAFAHGSQCGFCTPGVVMSMYSLIRSNVNPTMKEIEDNLIGNLCRCTGYRPIVEGFRSFSAEFNECGAENCCRKEKQGSVVSCTSTVIANECENDLPKDVIFPPKLLINKGVDLECTVFRGPRITWYIPKRINDLLEIKYFFPDAKIVAGGTIVVMDAKYKPKPDAVQIQATKVPELSEFHAGENGVRIGAAMSLSDVEERLRQLLVSLTEYKSGAIRCLVEMLQWFASKQIKNVASIGGNIMAGSAVSSLMQVLLACGARIHLKSLDNERFVVMDENFYVRDTKISPIKQDEVIMSVFITYTKENEFMEVYRQTRRRANDTSIVNAGMKVVFEENSNKVADLKLAFGAVAKTVVMAPKTMEGLKGLCWNSDLLEKSANLLFEDISLELGSPGGSIHYKRTLILSFFLKFYLKVQNQLSHLASEREEGLDTDETKPIHSIECPGIKSSQLFDENTDPLLEPIGKPIIHSSGLKHTTGEAIYINDMPLFEDELFGELVISQKAKATIEDIDPTEALKIEGVVRFVCHRDIDSEKNIAGAIIKDEEIFASKEVNTVGQVIGIILAKTGKAAKEASKRVKITYNESTPVLTIEEAINAGDDYKTSEIYTGNVDQGLSEGDQILEGEILVAGQEHFYMETQACICVPKEDGDMDIYCSSQHVSEVQKWTSFALGIPANKITIKVKRLGGGFGGKITESARLATVIAVAASKVGKPVRLSMDREVDMMVTGKRHSCLGKWKAAFKNNGIITCLDVQLFYNAGHCTDVSGPVSQNGLRQLDNVYSVRNFRATSKACKTNSPSTTACRGFGSPQAMFVMEDIITRVASAINIPQYKIREINMYPIENPKTYIGQPLVVCTIRKCWDEIMHKSDFKRRLEEANKFNRENKYIKKGIAISPTRQSVGYEFKALSQAGALVHIYLDGSVLLSHGAIEMGQGVHIKMIQIASKEFGISHEHIYTTENATDKVPNASGTAASVSADMNGIAVMNACKILKKRITPYQEKNPDGKWVSWVNAAYADQIQLSAVGFYKDDISEEYNFKTKTGTPFLYCTYGAAVTEIELDVLTGDHRVLRVDIVVDAGNSLNPAVDIGQIEGGYMFGYGLFTLEELVFSPKGHLRTKGPYTYKIPTIDDIPREFYVTLLRDAPNPRAVYSSKGCGEAPVFLGVSAYNAIKMAIMAARNTKTPFRLDSPATSERIRMACNDGLIEKAKPAEKSNYEKWSVLV